MLLYRAETFDTLMSSSILKHPRPLKVDASAQLAHPRMSTATEDSSASLVVSCVVGCYSCAAIELMA